MDAFDAWERATATARAELAAAMAQAERESRPFFRDPPPRPKATKRRDGPRDVGMLTQKLVDLAIKGLSPAGKEALRGVMRQYDREVRADRAERELMRELAPRGKGYHPDRKMVDRSHFEIKSDDQTFTFYPATWDGPDRQGDVIRRGAFARSIPSFLRAGWISSNHANDDEPIGAPLSAVEDDHGLRVTARFHSTAKGQAWRSIVRDRLSMGLDVPASIGFAVDPDGSYYDRSGGKSIRFLTSIDLFEASICNLAANPAAGFVSA